MVPPLGFDEQPVSPQFGGGGRTPGGLTLAWSGLNVWGSRKVSTSLLRTEYERVQLLDDVSGSIESGTLTAIMGPSGAGKTTLLAAVSMRIKGQMSGTLLLNGRVVTHHVLVGISGFVPQDDLAIESLSVKEHMQFMARMKMDRHTTESVRRKRIKELVREMAIGKVYDTKISALSGGERKRLSMAVQLINDPPILFCDEPTSGLDSWSAAAVVASLRSVAASGRAVLCALHQPASGTFQMFHRLLLLAGGRVAYLGPVDEARTFFGRQDLHCPVGYNEAEFLVNQVSTEERARAVCTAWDFTERTRAPEPKFNGHHVMANGKAVYKADTKQTNGDFRFEHYMSIESPGIMTQFYWLLWRSFTASKSEKHIWLAQTLGFLGLSLIIAIPYQGVFSSIEQSDIQNIQGLMYLIITETIFTFIYSVFNQFPSEMSILLREIANGLYTPGPYYCSKMILMIPRAIIEPFIYTSIIFWFVGLKGGFFGFLLFVVPVIFSANCANAYGTWLSATFKTIETACLVSVPIEFVGYLMAGNFINLASISPYVGWIRYFSVFFYSAEAISIHQWEKIDTIQCDIRVGLPCIQSGPEVLESFGYGRDNFNRDLFGMVVMYFAFHLLGFISLRKRSKKQPVY